MNTRLSNQDLKELRIHTKNNHGKEPIAFRNSRGEVVWVHPEEYWSIHQKPVPDSQAVKESQAANIVECLFTAVESLRYRKRRLL